MQLHWDGPTVLRSTVFGFHPEACFKWVKTYFLFLILQKRLYPWIKIMFSDKCEKCNGFIVHWNGYEFSDQYTYFTCWINVVITGYTFHVEYYLNHFIWWIITIWSIFLSHKTNYRSDFEVGFICFSFHLSINPSASVSQVGALFLALTAIETIGLQLVTTMHLYGWTEWLY